jgi:methyl-accepting chemotaxis protein
VLNGVLQEQVSAYEQMAAAVEEMTATGESISNQATNQEELCTVANESLSQLEKHNSFCLCRMRVLQDKTQQ